MLYLQLGIRRLSVLFCVLIQFAFLASMIQGNRANCAQFAQVSRLDWLVDRLQSQQASKGVLKVLHCVLIDSPEALTMIKEPHIQNIISLLDKHGRDPKVSLVQNDLWDCTAYLITRLLTLHQIEASYLCPGCSMPLHQ